MKLTNLEKLILLALLNDIFKTLVTDNDIVNGQSKLLDLIQAIEREV